MAESAAYQALSSLFLTPPSALLERAGVCEPHPESPESSPSGQCSQEEAAAGGKRWFEVLAELQSRSGTAALSEVAGLLDAALQAVRADRKWASSGIAELLQRSAALCERGSPKAATQLATGLLDFHRMVEKYRQVVTRSKSASTSSSDGSGSGKRTCGELDASNDDEACGPLKRQKSDTPREQEPCPCPAAPSCAPSSARPEFAVPHLPAKKQASAAASQVWSGAVQQVVNGRLLEYCKLSIQVPAGHVEELGSRLEVTRLASRRKVGLGQYRVCKCSMTEASRSQLAKLKSMAEKELVAVVPLQANGLLIVPYFDNAKNVKVVCFYLML